MFALDKTVRIFFMVYISRLKCPFQRYIHETDAVREALIALQGRQNVLLTWSEDGYEVGSPP